MSDSFDRSIELTRGGRANETRRRRFETHCAPFAADLFRFVLWMCRDRTLAEDVVQETLLRAWRSIDSLKDPEAARPWLLRIARRELSRVFERKRLPTVKLDTAVESGDDALTVSESHEVHDMRRAILNLDVLYREPLTMQVLLGFTAEEIAQQLQISVPTVLTRLFRARALLRKQLGGALDDGDECG